MIISLPSAIDSLCEDGRITNMMVDELMVFSPLGRRRSILYTIQYTVQWTCDRSVACGGCGGMLFSMVLWL